MRRSRRVLCRLTMTMTLLALAAATARPTALAGPPGEADILTPRPGPAPAIRGPKAYGCRPGHPFLHRIPCTGRRPIRFSAEGLPAGLTLDADTGVISGRAPSAPGTFAVVLSASSEHGRSTRPLRIVVGDTLALTPPMGWNDWYTWTDRITDARMRSAADILIGTGMADFGYEYINIDDCWMVRPGSSDPELGGPARDDAGAMRPNGRFPDMKALTDSIHARGLKAGLYTSPGRTTCAGFAGSYEHEEVDARKYAEWGFDFLKYDWCSYTDVAGGSDRAHLVKPYALMGGLVGRLDRDIVFNLCQYGMGNVWEWGGDVGGQCWRTTGDVGLEKADHLPGFYRVGLSNAAHARNAAPGRWNDPDYLLIGVVGKEHCGLTANEEHSYMSMWSLMAAPLFYSGDMEKLDAFTLSVLCNAEVIDVDQDPLGIQARVVRKSESDLVLAKPLEDGSIAVGLFNLGEEPRELAVSWAELKLSGEHRVRDLWRQKDLGTARESYSARVDRHGVMLVRLAGPRA
ncbi:putative Ig domain-containing protein [Aquisphaera insulae]|uniref:putative Ig domain-containing protein n=1 Tax=Aquisphaera insulae TaxID=2712864 RepID=UPI0013ECCA06|nr:putative Ig domain-containing protein [Aquisphaera insulae]